jgi:BMFP domain-containing protein YqiC
LQDKLKLLREDRDVKDKNLKKAKAANEELRNRLKDLEMKNNQMSLKIEQNFSSGGLVHPS